MSDTPERVTASEARRVALQVHEDAKAMWARDRARETEHEGCGAASHTQGIRPMKTHVEFEDVHGKKYVMPCEAVLLAPGREGLWYVEHSRNMNWSVDIPPETAARLRRELLGEPAAMPEEACPEAAVVPASPSTVVTGPGVYRDVQGWGCRIVGRREDGRWYAESPDGRRCQRAWNDDGRPDLYPQNTLVARVADLSAWDPHGEDHFRANPEELATMLSSTVPSSESLALDLPGEADAEPAAEPEFVLWRYAVLDAYGRLVQTFNPDEEGRQIAEAWRDLPENLGRARVAPLFLRREDATP